MSSRSKIDCPRAPFFTTHLRYIVYNVLILRKESRCERSLVFSKNTGGVKLCGRRRQEGHSHLPPTLATVNSQKSHNRFLPQQIHSLNRLPAVYSTTSPLHSNPIARYSNDKDDEARRPTLRVDGVCPGRNQPDPRSHREFYSAAGADAGGVDALPDVPRACSHSSSHGEFS